MKKKIILICFLLVIILGEVFLLLNKDKNKEEVIVQSNKRDESVFQIEVINDYINIRKEANSHSDILGKVYKKEIYTVLDTAEDTSAEGENAGYQWYKIKTSNDIEGFIVGKYDTDLYVKELKPKEETKTEE